MDVKRKMFLYLPYTVLLQTVYSQSSTSRILTRLDRLEDDVIGIRKALKEESDLCRKDISTLSKELRNLRKDLNEERQLRRGDISKVSNKLTESSGQVVRHDTEQIAIAQHGSCDCGAIVSQYKHVMNAFKSEKSENVMVRKKFDEMSKQHDDEIGNFRELINNVVSRLNNTDRTLRSEIGNIKNETKETLSVAQKLVHDSYVACQKEINDTRAYLNAGFIRVNESLTNPSLNALQEISRITSGRASLNTSKKIVNTITDQLHHPHSCDEVEKSGEYKIHPRSHPNGIMVYCSKDSTNKGWIVIQRRADGSVNFNRTWSNYKAGFGNLSGEFWLGNEHIYQLTKDEPRELQIDMQMFYGTKRYALYSKFSLSSETEKYKLQVAGYSGDAGDDLTTSDEYGDIHNGQSFSTFDADNDIATTMNCANYWGGGWWHTGGYCFIAHLNGKYTKDSDTVVSGHGIHWYKLTGFNQSLKKVSMAIR